VIRWGADAKHDSARRRRPQSGKQSIRHLLLAERRAFYNERMGATGLEPVTPSLASWHLLHVVPVLLGGGARLFDGLDGARLGLECTRVVEAPGVVHLTCRVELPG
jgi:hypothetical protein